MAADPKESSFKTASEVQWDNGEAFNGYVLIRIVPPSGKTKYYLKGKDQRNIRIPDRVRIPIEDGALDDDVKFWKNADLDPANIRYADYWYDDSGTNIANGAALFQITADEHTLTPPTLTAPTVASSVPAAD